MEKIETKIDYILKELLTQGTVLVTLSKSFNEFRSDFDGTITAIMQEFKFQREYMDKRFDALEDRLGTVEYDVAMIKHTMTTTMATKEDIGKIDSHIGNMERRLQNTESIVLKDHRPRIRVLEKSVGVGI